jgi:hypothetical protein
MIVATTLPVASFLVAWTIATTAAILVFLHANKRGSKHATAWGIGVFAVLGIVLPAYLVHNRRHRPPADGRRY